MAKFVLAYHGGSGMPETQEEVDAMMAKWGAWYGRLGDAVLDGGNPFAGSTSIAADGSVGAAPSNALTGYTIINATDMADAQSKAKGCPVLEVGATVEVCEAIDM